MQVCCALKNVLLDEASNSANLHSARAEREDRFWGIVVINFKALHCAGKGEGGRGVGGGYLQQHDR